MARRIAVLGHPHGNVSLLDGTERRDLENWWDTHCHTCGAATESRFNEPWHASAEHALNTVGEVAAPIAGEAVSHVVGGVGGRLVGATVEKAAHAVTQIRLGKPHCRIHGPAATLANVRMRALPPEFAALGHAADEVLEHVATARSEFNRTYLCILTTENQRLFAGRIHVSTPEGRRWSSRTQFLETLQHRVALGCLVLFVGLLGASFVWCSGR